jgi:hypothetical protein
MDGQLNGVVVDHVRVAERRATHELNANTFTLHRQELLEKKVRAYLAGRIAQRRFSPRSWRSRHDSGDRARDGVVDMRVWRFRIDLIERSWSAVEAVAGALATHQVCRQRRRVPCAGRRSISSCT